MQWIDSEHLEPTQQNTDEYNDAFKRLTQSQLVFVYQNCLLELTHAAAGF